MFPEVELIWSGPNTRGCNTQFATCFLSLPAAKRLSAKMADFAAGSVANIERSPCWRWPDAENSMQMPSSVLDCTCVQWIQAFIDHTQHTMRCQTSIHTYIDDMISFELRMKCKLHINMCSWTNHYCFTIFLSLPAAHCQVHRLWRLIVLPQVRLKRISFCSMRRRLLLTLPWVDLQTNPPDAPAAH